MRFSKACQAKQLEWTVPQYLDIVARGHPLLNVLGARDSHTVPALFKQQERGDLDVCRGHEPHGARA